MTQPDHDRFRLYYRPLSSSSRQAEREASLSLVREVFGPDATYTHEADGAPLLHPHHEGVYISISHSRNMCVLATAHSPIGADIESPRVQLVRVADKFLSEREKQVLTGNLSARSLLPYWTAKEAVYKAARTPGLSLTEIEVTADSATARGHRYSLHYITPPTADSLIAIALAE